MKKIAGIMLVVATASISSAQAPPQTGCIAFDSISRVPSYVFPFSCAVANSGVLASIAPSSSTFFTSDIPQSARLIMEGVMKLGSMTLAEDNVTVTQQVNVCAVQTVTVK